MCCLDVDRVTWLECQLYAHFDLSCVGLSDPYVLVTLNDQKIHKTKIHKKTLNPVFNESVQVAIPSRLRSNLQVRVFDYNVTKDFLLGVVDVDLAKLAPGQVLEKEYMLSQAKSGTLKLRMYFDAQQVFCQSLKVEALSRNN